MQKEGYEVKEVVVEPTESTRSHNIKKGVVSDIGCLRERPPTNLEIRVSLIIFESLVLEE